MQKNNEELDFQVLFESLPGLYLVLLPDAPRFTITAVSDAYNKQTMTKRNKIMGKGLFEVFPDNPDDEKSDGVRNLRASLKKVIATKKTHAMAVQKYDIQLPIEKGGGFEERFWAPLNTPVFDSSGKLLCIIHQVEDVTNQVKLKEDGQEMGAKIMAYTKELSRAHKELQLRDRNKDLFLATLAHELRNPLAAILSGIELLKTENGSSEVAKVLERQSSHLSRLVDDLIDSSRISRGKLKLAIKKVELRQLIKEVVASVKQTEEGMERHVHLSLPEKEIHLEADPVRISQVLSNLLSNSTKFTAKGGNIWIKAEVSNEQVAIELKDDGAGIEKEKLENIFEKFYQKKTTKGQEGLGLGLSICRSLLEMHDGSISAFSGGPGKGFEVQIGLPIKNTGKNMDFKKRTPSAPLPKGLKVLIADDNKDAADMLKRILEQWGAEVATASDGKIALQKAKEFKPDLILMDLGMPEMNGYETTLRLRREDWGKDINVWALSGWGQEEDKQKTSALGFDGHLVKPVSPQDLKKSLLKKFSDF